MNVIEKMKHKKLGVAKFRNDVKALFASAHYYVTLSLIKLLSYIPFRILYVLSDILFYPFYYLIRYRRKIVRRNLTESFPEKSLSQIIGIEKEFYHFFLDMALESCKLISISPEEIGKRMQFTNIQELCDMLSNGQSISLFLGHIGNWEWITSMSLLLNKKAVSAEIYHKLKNDSMDKIMRQLRERMGSKCVDMHQTIRFMATAAREDRPYIIGFIADQSPKRRESKYFIPFLNHQTPVLTGTEKATKHFGYKAIFARVKRVRRGYYVCDFVSLHDNPQSLPDFELTNLYFKRLEDQIKLYPELYLWTHNRFKYALDRNN